MRIQKSRPAPVTQRSPESYRQAWHSDSGVNKINIPFGEGFCYKKCLRRICVYIVRCVCKACTTPRELIQLMQMQPALPQFCQQMWACTLVLSRQQHGACVAILGQWSRTCRSIFSRPLVLPGNCSLLYVPVWDYSRNHGVFHRARFHATGLGVGVVKMWWEIMWIILAGLAGNWVDFWQGKPK